MASGDGGYDFASLELSIDVDGNWQHQDIVITHERVLAMLYLALQKMGDGYFVCTEGLCLPVRVADCPYVVLAVRHEPEQITLLLTNGRHVALDPAGLTIDADSVPRCTIDATGVTARFSRAAWSQLAEAIEDTGDGGFVLRVGDRKVPVTLVG